MARKARIFGSRERLKELGGQRPRNIPPKKRTLRPDKRFKPISEA